MNNERTVAEFFAGIGLMRMGLEQAGWNVVWANDIDEDKMKMYQGHYADVTPTFTSATFTPSRPTTFRPLRWRRHPFRATTFPSQARARGWRGNSRVPSGGL